jgi:hypothetical protein
MLQPLRPLRDIREDLRVRLERIGVRRQEAEARYKEELSQIDKEEKALEAILALEEKEAGSSHITAERSWAQNALENEILDILSNEGGWEHSDIKAALLDRGHGHGEDQSRFGQSIQGTLLSMSHRDLVESAGYGKWKITKYGLTGEQE